MLKWFNCYLSGRHDFGVWCEPGAIFLRCVHCGKRSSGWAIDQRTPASPAQASSAWTGPAKTPSRVLPFSRAAAR